MSRLSKSCARAINLRFFYCLILEVFIQWKRRSTKYIRHWLWHHKYVNIDSTPARVNIIWKCIFLKKCLKYIKKRLKFNICFLFRLYIIAKIRKISRNIFYRAVRPIPPPHGNLHIIIFVGNRGISSTDL